MLSSGILYEGAGMCDGSVFISQGRLRASYVSAAPKAFIQKLVDELYKAGIHRQKILMTTSEP